MNVYEALLTRRSTRKMKDTPVSREELDKILAAGRAAPCGSNSQTTHFIVIENRDVLQELAILVQDEFAKMEIKDDMYVSLKNSVKASKRGNYKFHYGAPTLIVTANKIGYGNNIADCACAIENMMVEANALNLGSCWINQLHWLADNSRVREYMLNLGMAEDETVCASMILGYPDTKDSLPNRTERKITGNPVTYVQ